MLWRRFAQTYLQFKRVKMSAGTRLENENPVIFQRTVDRLLTATDEDEDVHDPIDDREIFDILSIT